MKIIIDELTVLMAEKWARREGKTAEQWIKDKISELIKYGNVK